MGNSTSICSVFVFSSYKSFFSGGKQESAYLINTELYYRGSNMVSYGPDLPYEAAGKCVFIFLKFPAQCL